MAWSVRQKLTYFKKKVGEGPAILDYAVVVEKQEANRVKLESPAVSYRTAWNMCLSNVDTGRSCPDIIKLRCQASS